MQLKRYLLWGALALSWACGKEMRPSGNDTDMAQADLARALDQRKAIRGTWVSQGADLAPLLASEPFHYVKITAIFEESTYKVTATDKDARRTELTGTWGATLSSVMNIAEITLNQATPYSAVARGIYQVDTSVSPARMTYEVVQVQPDIKATPPTPEGGFGSTSGGALMMRNVQKFVKEK